MREDVLNKDALFLNRRFFTFHTKKRPYIILKWAQSRDGFMAETGKRTKITNIYTDKLVHQWRAEEAAIMVGTNTALTDDPSLTVRYAAGPDPVRVVVDKQLKMSTNAKLYNDAAPTLILNGIRNVHSGKTELINMEAWSLPAMMHELFIRNIQSVIVEGGATLLNSFIAEGLYDEIRQITNTTLILHDGVKSPALPQLPPVETRHIKNDLLEIFVR